MSYSVGAKSDVRTDDALVFGTGPPQLVALFHPADHDFKVRRH